MKLKKLSILAGAVAVAFSITPLAVNAQVNSNAPQRVSQANRPSPPDLKLSQPQIQKITQIRSKQGFASIQFTQKQQEELRNIMVGSQKQMEGVLDAKQKKILNEWRASQRGQRKK